MEIERKKKFKKKKKKKKNIKKIKILFRSEPYFEITNCYLLKFKL